ncbi:MAG TPA: glycosyltransferase, partial [Candidatus Cloacimonetes bacterium]|nr:glycosyltransferase [Candidatus Cloacimonadota bacterium]
MIFIILSFIYAIVVLSFCFGILFLKQGKNNNLNKFSIIIAARNEEKNLPQLLENLVDQNYPQDHYEIIVADDRSSDRTSLIVKEYIQKFPNLKLIRIKEETENLVGKKNALNNAIKKSEYEILAFTDADCLPTKNWLSEINKHFDDKTDFVTGYSPLISKEKKINLLKNLERSSHFAVVAGSLGLNWKITCSARNMAYRKSIYDKMNGFSGIGNLRSG